MISELDETIRQMMINDGGFDPADIDVSFDIPNREWSATISKPTLNCYLFDIRENREMRQSGMVAERTTGNGQVRRRPPVRLDLTYLLTAWTRAVEDEHRLLWHTLATLMRFPVLPQDRRQGLLREHELPIYTKIAQSDGVLKSPGEFWTALENQLKPSLSYVVTLAIDRDLLVAGPPVLTSSIRFKTPDGASEEWIRFGGTLRDAQGAPLAGEAVAIEGHGAAAQTDDEGRFNLRVPATGRYTLVVGAGATARRHEVDVPQADYDLAFEAEPP
jgi:hypothetical protein